VPLLANPQSRVLTPFFLLHLLLGTFAAIRFEIFLHVLIGMIGFYKLARCRFELSIPASMLASAVFSLNSMLPLSFDFVPREPSPEFVQVKSLPVKQDYIVEKDTALVHLPWSIHYASMLRNIGIIACYESAHVSRNAIPQSHPRYRGEAFILEDEIPGAASARIRTWTPNELRIETRSAEDSTLVVNQNYDPGWKTADGREVRNLDGRIAVATRRGADSVTLEYSPRSAWFGLLTSALATIGVFLHWWRMRGR
jgi:hypothetical protein